jgi:tRNA dimethylallyltransferase
VKSSSATRNEIPVILIFGPTAVGKTDLLLDLFSGEAEIISADSMQVYRGIDIGSAKPPPEVRKALPHHLVDILEMDKQFTAGDFVRLADKAVPEIIGKGKIPVISGGTAFYFKNFIYGLPPVPEVAPEWREQLNREADESGIAPLYESLKKIDPETAERLHPADRSRIIRALEIYSGTGRRLSEFPLSGKIRDGYRYLVIGLHRERAQLYKRIERRVDTMFRQGLPDEIKRLISRGARPEYPAMQGIGYREFFQWQKEGCLSVPDLKERIARNTRRYAKRQLTFFRSIPVTQWINGDDREAVYSAVKDFYPD